MANKKFSQFTNQPSTANTFLVGYDGTTNVRIPESDSIFKKGHEPFSYPNGTYLTPIETQGSYNNDPFGSNATKFIIGGTFDNWAFPFMVQQDVILSTYNFYLPNGAPDDPLYFNMCVYEFDEVIDTSNTRFKLVKEEAKVIPYEAGGGGFYIGFTTPFRLIAGKIYLVCLIPQSGTILEIAGLEHNGTTKRPFPINKFLGGNFWAVGQGTITTKFTAVVTGTSAPSTIDCRHVGYTGDVGFEYIKMNLKNA